MKTALCALLFAVGFYPAWGQIAQSHPEYCGIPGDINPSLPDISATIDSSEVRTFVLYVGRGGSAARIPLERSMSEIAAVCPLPDGRLVVFGDFGNGLYVYVVDPAKASVVDLFLGFAPAISPDQRWMVFGKFYPRHTEGPRTDEYLLYDFTKSPTQNRPDGNVKNTVDVGTAIFPPGQKNLPGDNVWVLEDQQHLRASRLYWAADSRAILFTDTVAGKPKKIVLVTLDDPGAPAAFERPVTELCGREITSEGPNWRLEQVEIGPDLAGRRPIVLDFGYPWGRHCVMQFYKDDFQPTKPEVHVVEEPTGEPELIQEGGRTIRRMKRKK